MENLYLVRSLVSDAIIDCVCERPDAAPECGMSGPANIPEHKRNRAGRPPSSRTISALIRNTLGRDAQAIVGRLRVMAATGDPQAISAAAVLLASTIEK